MPRRPVDYPLLFITLALVVAGLFVMSSASTVISLENFGSRYQYLMRHAMYAAVGLAALFLFARFPYRNWKKVALPLLILALLAVAAVFIPAVGFSHGGATRWLKLGPTTVQPSEFLKFSLILYLAGWFDTRKIRAKDLASTFLPFLVIVGVAAILLVLQPDIGTLFVVAGSAIILYFLGGGRLGQIGALGLLGFLGLAALIWVAPYRLSRLLVFWNPGLDPSGAGYHVGQALLAIGSGGFWGRGFGQSIQKYSYLPEPIGDSIFAITVEEFGFFGSFLLVMLFLAFLLRAIAVARQTPDFFGKLLVAGFASSIALQAFINMAAISGFLPLTGIPLPFLSYGGTSLVVTLAMVGVMLNVSKSAQAS